MFLEPGLEELLQLPFFCQFRKYADWYSMHFPPLKQYLHVETVNNESLEQPFMISIEQQREIFVYIIQFLKFNSVYLKYRT